eukprot:534675-Prymnesium_polylepis.1
MRGLIGSRRVPLHMLPNIFPEWLLCWAQGDEKTLHFKLFGSVDRGEVCARQARSSAASASTARADASSL